MRDYGDPLSRIYETPSKPEWIYEGWFPRSDRMTVIHGDGGVGKSMFVFNLMLNMARGTPFMGREYLLAEPMTVLYMNLDMPEEQLFGHLHNVCDCLGLTRTDVDSLESRVCILSDDDTVIPVGYDLSGDLNVMKGMLERARPDICVVEGWSDMCGMKVDMNNANQVNSALRVLSDIDRRVSFLLVHHETKSKFSADGKRKASQHRMAGSFTMQRRVHRSLSISRARDSVGVSVNLIDWGKIRTGARPANFEYRFGDDVGGQFFMEYIGETGE